jgi:threonine/homoserine/homoserine lactone efflux protein
MLGIYDFGGFLTTCLLLNLAPGQDTVYILGRSVSQGRNAGIASALGISTGALVHTVAAALGLSMLLTATASAFLVVKLAGAAYLVYLGSRMLFKKASAASIPPSFESAKFSTIYRQGLITNVLNPKVALFFLALMPQFIAADTTNKFLAFITLGLCFVITSTIWCTCLAWFASLFSDKLRHNATFSDVLNRTAGALFIFLGVRLTLSK